MCGIFAYLGLQYSDKELIEYSNKIVHRGPDETIHKRINSKLFFSFHRLAINGLNSESGQPLIYDGIYLICNGEIFNYKELIHTFDLETDYQTQSDCEIIIHLYLQFGINETCRLLDGEFAFILYDSNEGVLYAARDQLGIRSLYWNNKNEELCFCSELKGIPLNDISSVNQFPCASYWCSNTNNITQYYSFIKNE